MLKWLRKAFSGDTRTVNEVVEAYASLLEKYPVAILDISMLPLPKAKMKVLFKALYAKQTESAFQSYFENGYLFLSQFQEGVGASPIDGKLIGGDIKANLDANIAILDQYALWQKLALAEVEILTAEWKRFKEGEPI